MGRCGDPKRIRIISPEKGWGIGPRGDSLGGRAASSLHPHQVLLASPNDPRCILGGSHLVLPHSCSGAPQPYVRARDSRLAVCCKAAYGRFAAKVTCFLIRQLHSGLQESLVPLTEGCRHASGTAALGYEWDYPNAHSEATSLSTCQLVQSKSPACPIAVAGLSTSQLVRTSKCAHLQRGLVFRIPDACMRLLACYGTAIVKPLL